MHNYQTQAKKRLDAILKLVESFINHLRKHPKSDELSDRDHLREAWKIELDIIERHAVRSKPTRPKPVDPDPIGPDPVDPDPVDPDEEEVKVKKTSYDKLRDIMQQARQYAQSHKIDPSDKAVKWIGDVSQQYHEAVTLRLRQHYDYLPYAKYRKEKIEARWNEIRKNYLEAHSQKVKELHTSTLAYNWATRHSGELQSMNIDLGSRGFGGEIGRDIKDIKTMHVQLGKHVANLRNLDPSSRAFDANKATKRVRDRLHSHLSTHPPAPLLERPGPDPGHRYPDAKGLLPPREMAISQELGNALSDIKKRAESFKRKLHEFEADFSQHGMRSHPRFFLTAFKYQESIEVNDHDAKPQHNLYYRFKCAFKALESYPEEHADGTKTYSEVLADEKARLYEQVMDDVKAVAEANVPYTTMKCSTLNKEIKRLREEAEAFPEHDPKVPHRHLEYSDHNGVRALWACCRIECELHDLWARFPAHQVPEHFWRTRTDIRHNLFERAGHRLVDYALPPPVYDPDKSDTYEEVVV